MLVLSQVRVDEPAALLCGAPQVRYQRTLGGPGTQLIAQAETELRQRLGDQRFAALAARGSTQDDDQAVELACRELARLTEQPSDDTPRTETRIRPSP